MPTLRDHRSGKVPGSKSAVVNQTCSQFLISPKQLQNLQDFVQRSNGQTVFSVAANALKCAFRSDDRRNTGQPGVDQLGCRLGIVCLIEITYGENGVKCSVIMPTS